MLQFVLTSFLLLSYEVYLFSNRKKVPYVVLLYALHICFFPENRGRGGHREYTDNINKCRIKEQDERQDKGLRSS